MNHGRRVRYGPNLLKDRQRRRRIGLDPQKQIVSTIAAMRAIISVTRWAPTSGAPYSPYRSECPQDRPMPTRRSEFPRCRSRETKSYLGVTQGYFSPFSQIRQARSDSTLESAFHLYIPGILAVGSRPRKMSPATVGPLRIIGPCGADAVLSTMEVSDFTEQATCFLQNCAPSRPALPDPDAVASRQDKSCRPPRRHGSTVPRLGVPPRCPEIFHLGPTRFRPLKKSAGRNGLLGSCFRSRALQSPSYHRQARF